MIDCEDCNGTGTVDKLDCSVGSASECCGGCYKEITCNTCGGSGETDYDEDLVKVIYPKIEALENLVDTIISQSNDNPDMALSILGASIIQAAHKIKNTK